MAGGRPPESFVSADDACDVACRVVREALSLADQFLSELPDEEDAGGFFAGGAVGEDVAT